MAGRLDRRVPWSNVVRAGAPSQAQIEAAVEQTLVGWGAELDAGQKFWWMDWNRMIRDAITAMRTGEPVLYDDGE